MHSRPIVPLSSESSVVLSSSLGRVRKNPLPQRLSVNALAPTDRPHETHTRGESLVTIMHRGIQHPKTAGCAAPEAHGERGSLEPNACIFFAGPCSTTAKLGRPSETRCFLASLTYINAPRVGQALEVDLHTAQSVFRCAVDNPSILRTGGLTPSPTTFHNQLQCVVHDLRMSHRTEETSQATLGSM